MASYVAKNGPEFEVTVRAKKDPRFAFLEKGHEYHPYYLKVRKCRIVGKGIENKIKAERIN